MCLKPQDQQRSDTFNGQKASRIKSFFNRHWSSKESQKPKFSTIGGVFATDPSELEKSYSSNTVSTSSSDETFEEWNSSGSLLHHKGAPLFLQRTKSQSRVIFQRDSDDENDDDGLVNNGLDNAAALGQIMMRSRKLPQSSNGFASNHIMINAERTKRNIPALHRLRDLDELAREHARRMANENQLFHSNLSDLRENFGKPSHRLGENVARGVDLNDIHEGMMKSVPDKNNIFDRRFLGMGIGTAKAADGTLYLCQLFWA